MRRGLRARAPAVSVLPTSPLASYAGIAHWDAQYNADAVNLSSFTDLIGGFEFGQGSGASQPTWSDSDTVFADGYSIAFDGSAPEYMTGDFPAIQDLFENRDPLSILMVAACTNNADATKALFSVADTAGGNNYWYTGYTGAEGVRLSIFDGGYDECASTTTGLTTAHYVLFTFDGANTAKARVNGVHETTDPGFFEAPAGLDLCSIGTRVTNSVLSPGYTGKIRDIAVFNTELTGADLTAVEAWAATRI